MKLRLPRWLRFPNLLALFAAVLMIATRGQAEPLPLERAIRLALAHSTSSAIADADVQRAFASYRELRNNYVPQLAVGSGLGWSYGFPAHHRRVGAGAGECRRAEFSLQPCAAAISECGENRLACFRISGQRPAQCRHPGRRPDLRGTGEVGGATRALAAGRSRRRSKWNKRSPSACRKAWTAPWT